MVFRLHTLRYLLRAQSLDNMLCYLPVTERFFFFFFSVAENAFHVFTNNAVNHMHSRSVLFVPRNQSYRHFTFSSPRRLNLINHSNFQRADYIFFLYIQPTTVSSLFHSFISIVVEDRRFSNNRYEVNKNCKIEF